MVTLRLKRVFRGVRPLAVPLVVALALGCPRVMAVELDAATPDQKRAAQKMFEAGDELYESGRFAEAAEAFRASYGIVASPNSRLMLARSLREAGKLAEAFVEYDAVAAEAISSDGGYVDARQAAEAERDALRPRLAWVTVRLPQDAPTARRFSVGHRALAVELIGSPVPATPGSVAIQVELSDGSIRKRDLGLTAAQEQTVDFGQPVAKPPAPAIARKPAARAASRLTETNERGSSRVALRTASYVAAGAGAVGLASFGVFAVMNRSKYNDLEADCQSGACPPDRQADIDAGERDQLFANIGLGVGAVGFATGAVLFVLSRPSQEAAPSVALLAEPGGLRIRGQF